MLSKLTALMNSSHLFKLIRANIKLERYLLNKCQRIGYNSSVGATVLNPDTDRMFLKSDSHYVHVVYNTINKLKSSIYILNKNVFTIVPI